MHTKYVDLARDAACYRDDDPQPDPLSAARGIVFAVIASLPVWALVAWAALT
jgi:hypothetical protein